MINRGPFKRFLTAILLLVIGGVTGYFIGVNNINLALENYRPKVSIEKRTPPKELNIDFYLFWDVWDRVSKNYFDKKVIDPQKMYYGAISGMVQALGDPYTFFLTPEQNKEVKQELSGQFEGIGAQLEMKNKRIVVTAPLPDSPAQRAGIKSGDFIVKVDGVDANNWTLPEAVSKIRGKAGTTVKLTLVREGIDKPIEISVVRSTINVKSVEGKVLDKKVAYIKLLQFGDQTQSEWLVAVNNIVNGTRKGEVKGLVLDLRNNSGGYLNGAVFIASEFLKSGTVVIQDRGQNGGEQKYEVSRRGALTDVPMVVLINKGSASASEIVAGALRDNKKVKLIGETSFGKGTIQDAQDLGGGAGLHITVAKWLTPAGTWVNGNGLTPDIVIAQDENSPSRDVQLEKAIEELLKLTK